MSKYLDQVFDNIVEWLRMKGGGDMERLSTELNELFREARETTLPLALLSTSIVDLIHCTEKMEFVDKLAKTLYTNTQSIVGIKIIVDSFIKIFGKATDVDKDFDSENINVTVYFNTYTDEDDNLISMIMSIAEIQYRNIETLEGLRKMTMYDSLTGAYCRTAGLDILEKEFSRVKRSGASAYLAFIDLDNLKKCNDSLGHASGDMLLKDFALTCNQSMRRNDFLVRYGGDEFLIFIDSAEPEYLIQRIQKKANASFSYGLVDFKECQDLSEAIEKADMRMYENKRKVKGTES